MMFSVKDEHYKTLPKLSCCEKIKEYACVSLIIFDYDETGNMVNLSPPEWRMIITKMKPIKHYDYDETLYDEESGSYPPDYKPELVTFHHSRPVSVVVDQCPFCGTDVQGVRLKAEPPTPIMSCHDGNYCDTCDERINCCTCYPFGAAWEVCD